MNSNHSKVTYRVKGMTCVGCEGRIENILSKMKGVTKVNSPLLRTVPSPLTLMLISSPWT